MTRHAPKAVVFDVGETLVDETRMWTDWADWLGVPRLTFLAALGAVIARGGDHRDVFPLVRPGIDLDAEWRRRVEAGRAAPLGSSDFYPDAEPCLGALHRAGYRLGIVGNQPATTDAVLQGVAVPLEIAASSETWGIAKPDAAFFERIAEELGLEPAAIAYVGDRVDNDVRPAAAAGMMAVFVRRGPWALIQAGRLNPPEATVSVESLADLPAALATLRPGPTPSSGRRAGNRS
jgi:FMN phosphatase YigB (HAD superfamily)